MPRYGRRSPRTNEIWPGFVDALSTLLLVFIFLLVVFMLAQFFLNLTLSARDEALDKLTRQVSELSDLLSLERKANADLRLNIAQISAELQSSTAERDQLSSRLTDVLAERDDLLLRLGDAERKRDDLASKLTTALSERDTANLQLKDTTKRLEVSAAEAEALRKAMAEAEKTITTDRATIELKLRELASLRQDISALRSVRAELEAKVSRLAAVLDRNKEKIAALEKDKAATEERNRVLVVGLDEKKAALTKLESEFTTLRDRTKSLETRLADQEERTTLAQKEIKDREIRLNELRLALQQSDQELNNKRRVGARAQAQIELLNQQIAALRRQLARIAKALDAAEAEAENKDVIIADLGKRLNLALASRVEKLERYRSDFFGRLREVLGNRPGIRIEGDRFVFQSEVLFASGSAVIEEGGKAELAKLAKTLLEIAAKIPTELNWILRVDGHTDRVPIHTAQFPSNWELSTSRAISVVRYLTELGVPPRRLAATGFGEFQPLDPHDDEIAYRRNRRIELKLTTR